MVHFMLWVILHLSVPKLITNTRSNILSQGPIRWITCSHAGTGYEHFMSSVTCRVYCRWATKKGRARGAVASSESTLHQLPFMIITIYRPLLHNRNISYDILDNAMNIVYALPNWVNYNYAKQRSHCHTPRTSICDDNFDPATMYVNGKGACAIVYCK